MAPEVPILIMVRVLFSGFLVLVFGSMLTAASSSLRTMSMLSVPIPVERTSTSWLFRVPRVMVNSRRVLVQAMVSKCWDTDATRSGSPTVKIRSGMSEATSPKW